MDGSVVTVVSGVPGLGRLQLEATRYGISQVRILPPSHPLPSRERAGVRGAGGVKGAVLRRAVAQLRAYLTGRRHIFTCRLDFYAMPGSLFQRKVWKALLAIPFGQTRTYGEVARMIGRPKASRAVGSACSNNPVAIVVPCHRVIGSNGRLAGYSAGLTVKRRLLQLEGGKS